MQNHIILVWSSLARNALHLNIFNKRKTKIKAYINPIEGSSATSTGSETGSRALLLLQFVITITGTVVFEETADDTDFVVSKVIGCMYLCCVFFTISQDLNSTWSFQYSC
jgi:hypothetical protein